MRRFALLAVTTFLCSFLSACAEVPAPGTSAAPPDRSSSQRYNAEKGQSELSREIDKVKD
jgi:hypothetical protein